MNSATLNSNGFFPRETYSSTKENDKIGKAIRAPASSAVSWILDIVLGNFESMNILMPYKAGVRDYLIKHNDMSKVVFDACVAARRHLDLRYQLSLELYRDPEEDNEHLVLYVRQEKYDENIMDTIDKINEEFEGDLDGKSGWFLVTTDFKRPRRST